MSFFKSLFKGAKEGKEDNSQGAVQQPKKEPSQRKDRQMPAFGQWLALKDVQRDDVVKALGMRDVRTCKWDEGLHLMAGAGAHMFVTDEKKGIRLVISNALPDLGYRVKALPWLCSLDLPEIRYFAVAPNAAVYYFAHIKGHEVLRAYAASQGEVRVNKGQLSEAEIALQYEFPVDSDEFFEETFKTTPSVQTILEIAAYCTIDPNELAGTSGVIGVIDKI